MFTLLHNSINHELFEKYVCNQSNHYENTGGTTHSSYHLKLKYPLTFSVNNVQLVTQQLESRTVQKVPL